MLKTVPFGWLLFTDEENAMSWSSLAMKRLVVMTTTTNRLCWHWWWNIYFHVESTTTNFRGRLIRRRSLLIVDDRWQKTTRTTTYHWIFIVVIILIVVVDLHNWCIGWFGQRHLRSRWCHRLRLQNWGTRLWDLLDTSIKWNRVKTKDGGNWGNTSKTGFWREKYLVSDFVSWRQHFLTPKQILLSP